MSAPRREGVGDHYIWRVAGKPVSVHLRLSVVEKLQPEELPAEGRGIETGGILLGYSRKSGDGYLVSVEDFEPLGAERTLGASWSLSRSGLRALESRLRRFKAKNGEPGVVGWYRTHTRPGLYLDQRDYYLFRDFFLQPEAIALVIRPDKPEPVAGVFFWENGDIERSRTYKSFPFSSAALMDSGAVSAGAAGAAATVRDTRAALPASAPSHAPTSNAQVANPGAATNPRATTWRRAALLAPIAAGIALGVFWDPRPLRRNKPVNVSELKSRDREQERAVFEAPPPPQPTSDVYTPPPEDPNDPEAGDARPVRPPRQLVVPVRTNRRAPEPQLDVQAPVISASARFEALPPARHVLPRATATIEPVKFSAFRRAVGSIPGLGFLKRRKHSGDEDFVPAKAVREVHPLSPEALAEPTPVRIRIAVGTSGEVERADLMTRSVQPLIAGLALEAARKWRFEPAKLDAKPVASELVLNFQFGANDPDGS